MSGADILIASGASMIRTPAGLNHAIYARRHSLRYVFDMTPVPVSMVYLHKVEVLRRHLATADWVFWIDDDAFFTNLDLDLRAFLPTDPAVDLVFCASPINPEGGWTWMSAGQFFLRNTPRMHSLLDAVVATDIAAVRAWWDPDTLGLFTKGDQDAFVYQLRRDDSPWANAWEERPWEAFNSRPYHYEARLDEHFLCHFAVPGGLAKMELIANFAERLGTTTALVDPSELIPYRTFIDRSEMARLLEPARSSAARSGSGPRRRTGLPWRLIRAVRGRLG